MKMHRILPFAILVSTAALAQVSPPAQTSVTIDGKKISISYSGARRLPRSYLTRLAGRRQ